MSHVAVGLVQRKRTGSSTTKAVLMFMAGCASDDGTGVWTSKTNMAADLEMSKRSVQRAVQDLIDAGIISECGRKKCRHGYTVEYRVNLARVEKLPSTRDEISPDPVKSTGDTVSPLKTEDTTCRGDTQSRVTHSHPTGDTLSPHGVTQCHPNLTGTIPESIAAVPAAQTQDIDEDDGRDVEVVLERFIEVYPRSGSRDKIRSALKEAIATGVEPDTLIAAARRYADEQQGNAQRYIAYPENWLAQRRWDRHAGDVAHSGVDPETRLKTVAGLIETGHRYLCTHVTGATARELLSRRMVTEDQLQQVGVQW